MHSKKKTKHGRRIGNLLIGSREPPAVQHTTPQQHAMFAHVRKYVAVPFLWPYDYNGKYPPSAAPEQQFPPILLELCRCARAWQSAKSVTVAGCTTHATTRKPALFSTLATCAPCMLVLGQLHLCSPSVTASSVVHGSWWQVLLRQNMWCYTQDSIEPTRRQFLMESLSASTGPG